MPMLQPHVACTSGAGSRTSETPPRRRSTCAARTPLTLTLTPTLTLALTLTLTLTLTRRVHGQVPRAPGTPPRAAERALDQRHHQGPGGEAQDQWHVERQGSVVIHGRAREPPWLYVRVKVLIFNMYKVGELMHKNR